MKRVQESAIKRAFGNSECRTVSLTRRIIQTENLI